MEARQALLTFPGEGEVRNMLQMTDS